MTKKFITGDKLVDGKDAPEEFLIPDIFDIKSRLIGIKTGKI